ncbi:thiamine-phosphate kinase [Zunongwangia profunda]|uniref:Thiamine-monophosphate kinase n=2 Tax=Zunongwangia profunda TaxID=398743 RepID=D5BCR6_ZUNPS|nr:thiamine-phosphate kinase [Zunongwangia profunda]ADF50579.1 thiamine-monophosphate kinase [Zunongwangia profunda SM-A87]MAC63867.1 thiamine-phosphate kinase [Flavobacteriaceae bacterium]MAS69933.1 thiamine-phosphate kinase [Zunongwangia sp.]HCV80345.1 thiamine-phosphate kinase [Zunongwangia profunda]|tara:strand:- start:1639 stop:2691 length:1053 start_codon:yes stop_codon:yes gene_type:complete
MFDNSEPTKTSLSELGEFGLIDHLTKNFSPKHASTIKAIGDDAAVLDFKDKQTLVSTDMLVEGVHFDLAYMPLKHLGYKAVMVNASDIYAMNGKATHITVSIAPSNRFPVEALEELYAGIQLAADLYNIDVVGGDTTSSTSGLFISISVFGEAEKEDVVYRSGAQANDLLVVTGDLGAAYMGLQVLEREKQVFKANPNAQPDLDQYTYLIERQLKPEARKDIPPLLKGLGVKPTSMIDISDGLSSEVIHLCKNSKTGVNLYEEKVPLDPAVISVCEEFELDSTMIALSGGEDYELLFTIAQSDFDKIKGNPNLTVIGHMTEESAGMHLITRANQAIPLVARGWNSMKSED